MISCPNCGSNPRFDIATQKLLCPYCGSSFDVESFPEETSGATMQQVEGEYVGEPDKIQVTVYTCSQCGGELMSTDSDATAFCSYCGSHQILEERLSLQERPQRIIPFKITKEEILSTLRPEHFTGRAPEQTAEFLAECVKPVLDANRDVLGEKAELSV